MRIILLGPPGSGKGTQANFIVTRYNLAKISTGDILRQYSKKNNYLGKKIKKIIINGYLVDDDIIINLLINRIKKKDCLKGFLLDGFPRNIFQALKIKELKININYVIQLDISDELIFQRLNGRLLHLQSGRTYHNIYNPPKEKNKDDITGDLLIKRKDDKKKIIKKRLLEFHKLNHSLVKFYIQESKEKKIIFKKIDAQKTIKDISNNIKNFLDK